ncbi:Phage tail repeat like protein [compost metagenome]
MSKASDYIPGLGTDFKITSNDIDVNEVAAALPQGEGSGGVDKEYVDTALAGKANTGVSYTKAESDGKYPVKAHTHAIADVTNLQTTLDGKAASSHTHTIANVTNLQTTLDGKLTATKAATQAASTATDVAGLLADFNALLTKLKAANIMS